MDDLFGAKDENANTVLHLATQKNKLYQGKTIKSAQVLLSFLKIQTRCSQKILKLGNSFDWTPFSGAVAWGDLRLVEEMLVGLVEGEKEQIVNQADFSDTALLHLAAKYGHVEVFRVLLQNKAELLQKGCYQKTVLDIAIDQEQRGIIKAIIDGEKWKEAFKVVSTSAWDEQEPLRRLNRQMPDIAEQVMDRCCATEKSFSDNIKKKVTKMNTTFIHPEFDKFKVILDNHPMAIMANEGREELLQHPLCIATTLKMWQTFYKVYHFQLLFYIFFLVCLNVYCLTGPSSPVRYIDMTYRLSIYRHF